MAWNVKLLPPPVGMQTNTSFPNREHFIIAF